MHAYVKLRNEKTITVYCKLTQLHSDQILFKLVFVSHCYHESHRGELFWNTVHNGLYVYDVARCRDARPILLWSGKLDDGASSQHRRHLVAYVRLHYVVVNSHQRPTVLSMSSIQTRCRNRSLLLATEDGSVGGEIGAAEERPRRALRRTSRPSTSFKCPVSARLCMVVVV